MTQPSSECPIILCFSGLDPTGGAGLQADIETLISLGCHAAPIATSLTIQDTHDVKGITPIEPSLIISQARAILEDMPVNCVKIGLLGSVAAIEAIHTILEDYPNLPIVLDPIINAGGGGLLADKAILGAMETLLLPQVSVITPNHKEAKELADQADSIEACANELMSKGCAHVLITDCNPNSNVLTNKLWGHNRLLSSNDWDRYEGVFHGSGCTLASSIAGYLAHGTETVNACRQAQSYTWQSVRHGRRLGMGQLIPRRLFWSDHEKQSEWHHAN